MTQEQIDEMERKALSQFRNSKSLYGKDGVCSLTERFFREGFGS